MRHRGQSDPSGACRGGARHARRMPITDCPGRRRRLRPPVVAVAPPDGFSDFLYSPKELAGLGYRLAASSGTAFAAMVKAVRQSYECLAQGKMDPFLGPGGADKEMKAAQTTCGLEGLLEIERRTIKDH